MKKLWIVCLCLFLGLALLPGRTASAGLPTKALERSEEPPEPEAAVGGSTWIKQVIDDDWGFTGTFTAMAYDAVTDTPYIIYYENVNNQLMLAWRSGTLIGVCGPGNSWYCQAIDTIGDPNQRSSIDVRTIGGTTTIAISYYDSVNMGLKLYRRDCTGGDCTIFQQVIDSGAPNDYGKYSSVKLDSNGNVYIAYTESGAVDSVRFAGQVPSGGTGCSYPDMFICEPVDTTNGPKAFVSLSLDSFGYPFIAYYDQDNGDLKLAWYGSTVPCGAGTSYSCSVIDGATADVGKFPVLIVAQSAGEPFRIAYYDVTNGTLKYAESDSEGLGNCDSPSYNCYPIDQVGVTSIPTLDMTVAGSMPLIAYQDVEDMGLKLAYPLPLLGNCGPTTEMPMPPPLPPIIFYNWSCTFIDNPPSPATAGSYPSIVVDSTNHIYIAHFSTNGMLPVSGWLSLAFQGYKAFLPGIIR